MLEGAQMLESGRSQGHLTHCVVLVLSAVPL